MPAARHETNGPGCGWLGLAVLFCAGGGCISKTATPATRPDIVLVTIDTLRADRMGCYGDRQARTPNLDALAREGIRFETAVTPVPLTLPAHTSLLSGLQPYRHGVLDNAGFRLRESTTTLAAALSRSGYATAASIGAFVLDRRFGLDRGFDRYGDRFATADRSRALLDPSSVQRRADAVVAEGLATLETLRRPFFIWLHLYDPHLPYDPPSPEREAFAKDPYRGEIAFADRALGPLFFTLKERGLWHAALVVVAGDHGEDLDDHGEPSHGVFLYDTTLRVPLIFKLPGGRRGGELRRDLASLIDVAPTVAALARAELTGVDGHDLFGAAEPVGALYAESRFARRHFGWSELFALRDPRYKLVSAPRMELYDLQTDPEERRNLAEQQPERVSRMQRQLEQHRTVEVQSDAAVVGAEERAKLAALGYLGSSTPAVPAGAALPDPKDQVGKLGRLLTLQEQAVKNYQSGEYGKATALLEQALALEPRFIDAHAALADCWLKSGELKRAVEVYRSGLEISPEDAALRRGLETALELQARRAIEAGNLGSALTPLAELARERPEDAGVRFNLAKLQQDLGDTRAALDSYRIAARLDPRDTKAVLNAAILVEAQGGLAEAEAGYREVLARDPSSAAGHFLLGRLLIRRGKDPAEASEHLQRAHALDPSLPSS